MQRKLASIRFNAPIAIYSHQQGDWRRYALVVETAGSGVPLQSGEKIVPDLDYTSPWRIAYATAAARPGTSSLTNILLRCRLAVRGLIISISATSRSV